MNMAVQDRYYQIDATDKTVEDLLSGYDPVCGLPTGSGKSIVLCRVAEKIIDADINNNVLVLSHVQEIIEQNHAALERYFDGVTIGLYSAGVGIRDVRKITVASIQTVMNCPELFTKFNYILIDEAHRVSFDHKTGYRSFIKNITTDSNKPRCCGLTATPYRTKGGYIYEGPDSLFNKCSIDYTTGSNFTRLIDEGYLCEIFSKKTLLKMDTTGIKTTGGDFNSKESSERFNVDNITEAAILESIYFGKKYRHWLCFAIDIDHADSVAKRFDEKGIKAAVVHSGLTKDERKKTIKDFKNGRYRVLVNVDILTTGFDFPAIDLIIMLRPTKSPIIHVQTAGRGLRPVYASGYDLSTIQGRLDAIANSQKPHCLLLDFAGNTQRLGMINDPMIKKPSMKKGEGGAITKDCPECDFINHGAARVCCNCGHEFQIKTKLTMTASEEEIIKKAPDEKKEWIAPKWVSVSGVRYSEGSSAKAGRFIRVEYKIGLNVITEVVCIEAKGFARHKAMNWLKHRWSDASTKIPNNTTDILASTDKLLTPKKILVDLNSKYPEIKNTEFI